MAPYDISLLLGCCYYLDFGFMVLWFYNSKPPTFASKGDRHLISFHNITPESHIHPLTSKIAFSNSPSHPPYSSCGVS